MAGIQFPQFNQFEPKLDVPKNSPEYVISITCIFSLVSIETSPFP